MRFLYLSRGVGGAARAASQRGCARVYRGPCPGGARDADALEVLALLVGVALVAALPREEIRHPPAPARAAVAWRERSGARAARRTRSAMPCARRARARADALVQRDEEVRARVAKRERNLRGGHLLLRRLLAVCARGRGPRRRREARRRARGRGWGARARARENVRPWPCPPVILLLVWARYAGPEPAKSPGKARPRLQRGESSPRVSSSGLGCVRANVPKI